jgi:hypothetical protein
MNLKKALVLAVCMFLAVSCFAQGGRGKAELKTGADSITVDYGRPALKGRDMLSQLQPGQSWRMADKFELVVNSQVGQWGLTHDATKDLFGAAMKKEALSSPVELFTIDLKAAPKGGVLVLNWGTLQLSAEFQFAQ